MFDIKMAVLSADVLEVAEDVHPGSSSFETSGGPEVPSSSVVKRVGIQ